MKTQKKTVRKITMKYIKTIKNWKKFWNNLFCKLFSNEIISESCGNCMNNKNFGLVPALNNFMQEDGAN